MYALKESVDGVLALFDGRCMDQHWVAESRRKAKHPWDTAGTTETQWRACNAWEMFAKAATRIQPSTSTNDPVDGLDDKALTAALMLLDNHFFRGLLQD